MSLGISFILLKDRSNLVSLAIVTSGIGNSVREFHGREISVTKAKMGLFRRSRPWEAPPGNCGSWLRDRSRTIEDEVAQDDAQSGDRDRLEWGGGRIVEVAWGRIEAGPGLGLVEAPPMQKGVAVRSWQERSMRTRTGCCEAGTSSAATLIFFFFKKKKKNWR
jgi:hypothetical protein